MRDVKVKLYHHVLRVYMHTKCLSFLVFAGFFRRSITKNAVYQCKYGNNCDIDMYMRRKCQECRLKKCLNVGMRPECVVPEYQCAIKRESKRAQKEKDKPNSTTKDSVSPDKEEKSMVLGSNTTNIANGVKQLSPQQEEIIKQLVYFQDVHESPSEADIKRITVSIVNTRDSRFGLLIAFLSLFASQVCHL